MKSLGLYVHIPFCKSRCLYCDFISSKLTDDSALKLYSQKVRDEIDILGEQGLFDNHQLDTIYFGGGTPSLLKIDYFRTILESKFLNRGFSLKEFTIEANPGSIDYDTIIALKKYGLNRVSIGVQSLNDKSLNAIGRIHDKDKAIEAIKLAIKAGVEVSVDLMLGIPYQTKKDIKFFIDTVVDLGVNHISMYMLSLEEGTALTKLVEEGKLEVASDDEKVELLDYASSLLKEKGLYRYEVSNFARKGKEAIHNTKYWRLEDYIGVGVGSHSLVDNKRFYNPDNFEDYYACINRKELAHIKEEDLTESDVEEEYIMLAFRLSDGINLVDYKNKFGIDFDEKYKNQINKYNKFLNINNNNIFKKEEYLSVMNSIVVDFLS